MAAQQLPAQPTGQPRHHCTSAQHTGKRIMRHQRFDVCQRLIQLTTLLLQLLVVFIQLLLLLGHVQQQAVVFFPTA
jgi:hypothetical protein